MALKIGVVSQKGGVGKSTLSRMIACEYARSGWHVKIADMDASQGTSFNWQRRRIEQAVEPQVAVEMFRRVADVEKIADNYDLIVFDGAPHSTQQTLQIAQTSALIILPTGNALDDLEPTIRLAHELYRQEVPKDRLTIALCRVGNSDVENEEAVRYIRTSGYGLLKGSIPERTVYRRASDTGRAATETSHRSTNERAGELMQSIVQRLKTLTHQEAV
jgi:chromosome partitioning protein